MSTGQATPRTAIKWLIEYEGDEIFSDEDGPPWMAPREGVQRVYWYDETQRKIIHEGSRSGYWGWKVDRNGENGHWFGFEEYGAYRDYLVRYNRSPVIPLEGRVLHDHDWQRFIEQSVYARFGVSKGGWVVRERITP